MVGCASPPFPPTGRRATYHLLCYNDGKKHVLKGALVPEVDCALQQEDSVQFVFRLATDVGSTGADGSPGAWSLGCLSTKDALALRRSDLCVRVREC